jgi:hypothetical protein
MDGIRLLVRLTGFTGWTGFYPIPFIRLIPSKNPIPFIRSLNRIADELRQSDPFRGDRGVLFRDLGADLVLERFQLIGARGLVPAIE